MRELHYQRAGRLAWAERPDPEIVDPTDALVRPFIAGRCDGDTVPLHRPVSRAMQLGIALHAIDPVVACSAAAFPSAGRSPSATNPSRRSSRSARTSAASP